MTRTARVHNTRRALSMTAAALTITTCWFSVDVAAASRAEPALALVAAKRADFRADFPPNDVRYVADWALHSGDHESLPFIVVDKKRARVYVFSQRGHLLGTAPILLGRAIGDEFGPGVIDMDMYETRAWQRVTPAGRFRAEQYQKAPGKWILWVDYDSAIALHKVLVADPLEERAARLASPDADHRRITYGCINVSARFYDEVIHPTFRRSDGIVYVLPETRPVESVFATYPVPASDGKMPALARFAVLESTALQEPPGALVPAALAPHHRQPAHRPRGVMRALPPQARRTGSDDSPGDS